MPKSKNYVNEQILNLVGMTEENFNDWCKYHGYKVYDFKAKKLFFSLINSHKLRKIKDVMYEDGVEICKKSK